MFNVLTEMDPLKLRPIPWEGIARAVLVDVGEHFREELGPEGPWPDLQPETWARKESEQVLWEIGALSGSVGMEFGDDYAEVYSAGVEYAAAHDTGVKKRNLPARSFMWIDDRVWQWILDKGGELTWSKLGPGTAVS